MKSTALLLLLVVLALLAGCAPIPAAQPSVTQGPATVEPATVEPATATVAPPVTPTAPPTQTLEGTPTLPATAATTPDGAAAEPTVAPGFTTHRDPVAGFAIDYPAGWSITVPPAERRAEAQSYTASIRSGSSSSDRPVGQPVLPGETGIDVTVVQTQATTYEEALAERRAEILSAELGVTIAEEFEVELTGGLRAVRRQLETDQAGTVAEMTTFLNGKRIMVHGMGNLDQFDLVARSLRPIPQGGSGVSAAIPVGTALPASTVTSVSTPGAETTYTDAGLGFSMAVPAGWELCQDSGWSRLFCREQAEARGPEFPRFYLTVLPSGFTNEDFEAYNFISEEDVAALMALAVGESFTTAGTPGYSTFSRLPDTTVDERPAVVVENARVWEGGPNTKDRRVFVKVAGSTYMFGAYHQTAEELAEIERVLDSVRITAK